MASSGAAPARNYRETIEIFMNRPTQLIGIKSIIQNSLNPRAIVGWDADNIKRLRAAMLSGATLPPIGVIRLSDGTYEYCWGRHRVQLAGELSIDFPDDKYDKIAAVVIETHELTRVEQIGIASVENELAWDMIDGRWVSSISKAPKPHSLEDYVKQIKGLRKLGHTTEKAIREVLQEAPKSLIHDAFHLAASQIRNEVQTTAIEETELYAETDGKKGLSLRQAWKKFAQPGPDNPANYSCSLPVFKKLVQRHKNTKLRTDSEMFGKEFLNSVSGNFGKIMTNVKGIINRKLGSELIRHVDSRALKPHDAEKVFEYFTKQLRQAQNAVEKCHQEFKDSRHITADQVN